MGGTGSGYQCHACAYVLHDDCAFDPSTSSTFMHPPHILKLSFWKPQPTGQNYRFCDLCYGEVNVLVCRCELCDFDIHPVCTKLPEKLRHAVDMSHPLRLQPSHPASCGACRGRCASWRYRCEICCVDLHIACVLTPICSVPCLPPPPEPYFDSNYGNGVCSSLVSYNNACQNIPVYASASCQDIPGNASASNQYLPGNISASDQYLRGNASASASHGRNEKIGKKIFAIVGKLAVGVLTNAVFGIPASFF